MLYREVGYSFSFVRNFVQMGLHDQDLTFSSIKSINLVSSFTIRPLVREYYNVNNTCSCMSLFRNQSIYGHSVLISTVEIKKHNTQS